VKKCAQRNTAPWSCPGIAGISGLQLWSLTGSRDDAEAGDLFCFEKPMSVFWVETHDRTTILEAHFIFFGE